MFFFYQLHDNILLGFMLKCLQPSFEVEGSFSSSELSHTKEKKKSTFMSGYSFIRYGMDKIHLLAVNRFKTLLSGSSDLLSCFLFAHAERWAAA